MEVIVIEKESFYHLLEEVLRHFHEKEYVKEKKWVSQAEAMSLLHIKSKTTLQKWRNEGRIRFSSPERKIIVYDVDSIDEFLEKNARKCF